jgi:predicted flap endonuclease-1-like 5' DNA nuclease
VCTYYSHKIGYNKEEDFSQRFMWIFYYVYSKGKQRTMIATLEDIEGVGPAYAEKLGAAGIKTTAALLDQGATEAGRDALATASGIGGTLILKWINHLDLARIKGVGPQTAELLEGAGVDSVPELANRNAANLAAKLKEVNDAKNLMGTTPSESDVADWIAQAKELPRVVTH